MRNLVKDCALLAIAALIIFGAAGGLLSLAGPSLRAMTLPAQPTLSTLPALSPLDGVYRIRGAEGEKAYAGTATIEERGDVFHVVFATGPHAVVGTGIREGDYLAVSWRDKVAGLTLYKINGRKLEGRWIVIGMEGTGNETLTWVSPLEPEEQPRDERKMKGAE